MRPYDKELETLCLLFDTRKNDAENVRHARVLPLIDAALKKVKSEERLESYEFYASAGYRRAVRPAVGMIIATNTLWRGGNHFSWIFYEITKITEKGNIMVIEHEKLHVRYHEKNVLFSHDYTKRYVEPGVRKVARVKRLPCFTYDVYDAKNGLDSWFYDGRCVS